MEKKLIDLNRQFNVLILTSSKNQKHLIEVNQRLRDELKNKEMQLQKALKENNVLKENQKKYKNKLENIAPKTPPPILFLLIDTDDIKLLIVSVIISKPLSSPVLIYSKWDKTKILITNIYNPTIKK